MRLRATRRTAIANAVRRLPGTYYDFTGASLPAPWDTLRRAGLGTRIDAAGAVGYGAHNLLLNSATLSTQTLTTVVGLTYTLSFSGTGSVTLSGGASGTLNGTGASRVSLTFTATTTSVVHTVSGSVLEGQTNAGSTALAYVATAGAQVFLPRPTHDPVTLAALGLLVEGQGTNLLGPSTNMASADWVAAVSGFGKVQNAATSPAGSTAAKYVSSANFGPQEAGRIVSVTAQTYTQSVLAKAGELSFVYLQFFDGVSDKQAWFNLATGTTGTVNNATSRIQNVGNGWYLCSMTFTSAAATNNARFGVSNANGVRSWAGDGVSGAFFDAAQLETGSVATSRIPNPGTGSAVRVADDWFLSGAALDAALGASRNTFTIYVEWFQPSTVIADARVIYLGRDDYFSRIDAKLLGDGRLDVFCSDGSTAGGAIPTNTVNPGAINKAVIVNTGSAIRAVLNGGPSASFALALGAAQLPNLRLLHSPVSGWMNAYVRTARAFPGRAMSVAEMQALTA